MTFEVWVKDGNRWAYKGTVGANDSRQAALKIGRITGRGMVKVRPEGSRDKCIVYTVTTFKTVYNPTPKLS